VLLLPTRKVFFGYFLVFFIWPALLRDEGWRIAAEFSSTGTLSVLKWSKTSHARITFCMQYRLTQSQNWATRCIRHNYCVCTEPSNNLSQTSEWTPSKRPGFTTCKRRAAKPNAMSLPRKQLSSRERAGLGKCSLRKGRTNDSRYAHVFV
jgi:hypothetical protein